MNVVSEEELATTTPLDSPGPPSIAVDTPPAVGAEAFARTEPADATVTPTPSWSPPERIDHFEVVRPLGQGGMGAVYLARDTSLDRQVALKLLPAAMVDNPEAQERFLREARAQAQLTSPNVVRIYFIGRMPGKSGKEQLYFAMEHVDGESLEALLERGERLDPERARKLAIQAALGLRDAQHAGIIHRDVKPGNMLVDRKETLKIADFGLAKPNDPKLHLTKGNSLLGTPLYMAPEQATGDPMDHRADMYSLGCALYHLLAGEPPFLASTAIALLLKHVNDAPPPLRSKAPHVPPKLAAVVDRLLRKRSAERFPTYDALLSALEEAAPERLIHSGFWTRAGAAMFDAVLASVLIAFVGPLGLILHLVYLTAAHAFFGQTLGKYLLRIQVRRVDGSRLGLWRSLGRTVAALWLPFVLGFEVFWTTGLAGVRESVLKLAALDSARDLIAPVIVTHVVLTLLYAGGFLLATVHRQKRAIHDFVAGTEVIFRIPALPAPVPSKARPGRTD